VSLFFGTEDKGTAKIGQVLTYKGLERVSVEEAFAGISSPSPGLRMSTSD